MNDNKQTPQEIVEELLKPKTDSAIQPPPVKKEAKVKQSPLIKDKHYYDVKIETLLPATLTYRVLAEDAQQASELIKGMSPIGVKHKLIGKKDIKLTVYKAGSSFLEWSKNLLGR
jgi:hypothetical protein